MADISDVLSPHRSLDRSLAPPRTSYLPFSLPSFLSENFPEVARMGMSDEEEEEEGV